MFFCPGRKIRQREKKIVKVDQTNLDGFMRGFHTDGECLFHRIMMLVEPAEEGQEIKSVRGIKSAVLELFEWLEILPGVIQDKIVGGILHHSKQLFAFPDYSGTLAPGQNGCPKGGNFNVLLLGISMWDGNRVIRNKTRAIVFPYFVVQVRFEVVYDQFVRLKSWDMEAF